MSIPLVQDNQKDSINASLIAIKREEERLQALIAEADKKIAQLNELKVNKSDIVDEVTLNNMQSVTSNAVAEELKSELTTFTISNANFNYIKISNLNILYCDVPSPVNTYATYNLSYYIRKPKTTSSFCLMNNTTTAPTYNNKSNTLSLGQVFEDKSLRIYGATAIGGSGTPYQRVVGTAIWAS